MTKFRLRMLVAAVAVVIVSTAVMSAYIFHPAGFDFQGTSWQRIFEGAGIAIVAGTAIMLLMSPLISRRLELDKLKEKDETLSAILNNLDEGVLAADLKGGVLFANPAARYMTGMEDRDGSENPEILQRLPDPWDDLDLPAAVERCARERKRTESMVHGTETLLRVKLEHMQAFDDHKGGVLVVIQDLSEGRRLEANQQRFLTNAAHELRTPLSNIAFAAELLSTGDEEDPETRRRFLDHILSATHRMRQLSDTLLRISRVGWERREPEMRPVSLAETARAAAEDMRPLAESSGIAIEVEGEGLPVFADEALLEQALLSLLSNAIKNSERGSAATLAIDGPTVSVKDRGKGISHDELPYVFERFYRSREDSGGFGLGLSICKEIVESMQGEISIDSEPGEGTSVRIRLREAKADD